MSSSCYNIFEYYGIREIYMFSHSIPEELGWMRRNSYVQFCSSNRTLSSKQIAYDMCKWCRMYIGVNRNQTLIAGRLLLGSQKVENWIELVSFLSAHLFQRNKNNKKKIDVEWQQVSYCSLPFFNHIAPPLFSSALHSSTSPLMQEPRISNQTIPSQTGHKV